MTTYCYFLNIAVCMHCSYCMQFASCSTYPCRYKRWPIYRNSLLGKMQVKRWAIIMYNMIRLMYDHYCLAHVNDRRQTMTLCAGWTTDKPWQDVLYSNTFYLVYNILHKECAYVVLCQVIYACLWKALTRLKAIEKEERGVLLDYLHHTVLQ